MVDAVTVHILRHSLLDVIVPVADVLLCPQWSLDNCDDHPERDASFLCQRLSSSAFDHFMRSAYRSEVTARHPGITFTHVHGRHEKQVLDLWDNTTSLTQTDSDRPFFALMQIDPPSAECDEPKKTELWRMYCAMQLPGQHHWQRCLLARCSDFHGAACIRMAIDETLGRQVYSDMVSQTPSKADDRSATAELLREKFLTILSENGATVHQGAPAPSSPFHVLTDLCSTRAALAAGSLRDCLPFLGEILSPNVRSQTRFIA